MNSSLSGNQSTSRTALLRQVAQRNIDQGLFASIEWQIAKGGRLLDSGSVIADDLDWVLPENPLYRIYSMTKPIVAVMGVILMERCQLHLFTPLAKIGRAHV